MRGVQVPECAEVLVVHCATTVAQRGSAANKEERRWRRSPCVKIVSLRSKSSTRENAMQQFIEKYGSQIQGVLTGWDRLVLRGSLRRLNYGCWDERLGAFLAKWMEPDLWHTKLLSKVYAQPVQQTGER